MNEAIRCGVGRRPTTSGGHFVTAPLTLICLFSLLLLLAPVMLCWTGPYLTVYASGGAGVQTKIVDERVLRSNKLCQSMHTFFVRLSLQTVGFYAPLSFQGLRGEQNYFWQTILWRMWLKGSELSKHAVKRRILKRLHMFRRHICRLIGRSLILLWQNVKARFTSWSHFTSVTPVVLDQTLDSVVDSLERNRPL